MRWLLLVTSLFSSPALAATSIAGTVTGPDMKPIANVEVFLMKTCRPLLLFGTVPPDTLCPDHPSVVHRVKTNSLGYYRFQGLSPDKYFVLISGIQENEGFDKWPRTLTSSSSGGKPGLVSVHPGENITGIDIRPLASKISNQFKFNIRSPKGKRLKDVFLVVSNTDGLPIAHLDNTPPGLWTGPKPRSKPPRLNLWLDPGQSVNLKCVGNDANDLVGLAEGSVTLTGANRSASRTVKIHLAYKKD
jgi:hypothetical protein